MPRFEPPKLTHKPLLAVPSGPPGPSHIRAGGGEWYSYALSYKDAADALAELIVADPAFHSRLAAPMMFLYRHCVELHLKSLLLDAGELLDDPQVVPPQHYLRTLWKRVRALLLRISPESDGQYFIRAAAIIQELDTTDPMSFAFRYPVTKSNVPLLPDRFALDPANVRMVIDELHILLDGASTQIDVYMDYKHECP